MDASRLGHKCSCDLRLGRCWFYNIVVIVAYTLYHFESRRKMKKKTNLRLVRTTHYYELFSETSSPAFRHLDTGVAYGLRKYNYTQPMA